MKRRLSITAFTYGSIWILLAGLNLLAGRFLGKSLDWWIFSVTLLSGALGDWLTGQLKSRRQHEKQVQEKGAASNAPTNCG